MNQLGGSRKLTGRKQVQILLLNMCVNGPLKMRSFMCYFVLMSGLLTRRYCFRFGRFKVQGYARMTCANTSDDLESRHMYFFQIKSKDKKRICVRDIIQNVMSESNWII